MITIYAVVPIDRVTSIDKVELYSSQEQAEKAVKMIERLEKFHKEVMALQGKTPDYDPEEFTVVELGVIEESDLKDEDNE